MGLTRLLVGFSLDDDQVHSPNEKFEMVCFHKGQRALCSACRRTGPRAGNRMIDWSAHYARRAAGMAGSDVSELLALLSRPEVVSFAGGIPDPSLFPGEALRAAYDFVLSHPKRAAPALQYSVPEGDPRPQSLDRRGHEPSAACAAPLRTF